MEATKQERLRWFILTGDEEPFPHQLAIYRSLADFRLGDPPLNLMLAVPPGTGKQKGVLVSSALARIVNGDAPRRTWILEPYRASIRDDLGIMKAVQSRLQDVASGKIDIGREARLEAEFLSCLQRERSVRDKAYAAKAPPLPYIDLMMGGLKDGIGYAIDPTAPATIVATVHKAAGAPIFLDRRFGRKSMAIFAGLFMCDSLVVLNECDRNVPALEALRDFQAEQEYEILRGRVPWIRPMHLVGASATPPKDNLDSRSIVRPCRLPRPVAGQLHKTRIEQRLVTMRPGDKLPQFIKTVIHGEKRIHLVAPDQDLDAGKVPNCIARLMLARSGEKALGVAFLNGPEDAVKVASLVAQGMKTKVGAGKVSLVTGTMRSRERLMQELNDRPYQRFLAVDETAEDFMALVASPCIECGVDGSGCFGVTEMADLPTLLQRLGRVGRRGTPCDFIVVLNPGEDWDERKQAAFDAAMTKYLQSNSEEKKGPTPPSPTQATMLFLQQHLREHQTSSLALLTEAYLSAPQTCVRPKQPMLPVSPHILDSLSMVSAKQVDARKLGENIMFGYDENVPYVEVAYRLEQKVIHDYLLPGCLDEECPDIRLSHEMTEILAEVYRAYPVLPYETLEERADRAFNKLREIAILHPEAMAAIMDGPSTVVEVLPLKVLATSPRNRIEYMTVVLPPEVGGLDAAGILDPRAKAVALDCADEVPATRARAFATIDRGKVTISPVTPGHFEPFVVDEAPGRGDKVVLPNVSDNLRCSLSLQLPDRELLYFRSPVYGDDSGCPQLVEEHCFAVATMAKLYGQRLGLPPEECESLHAAGMVHDLGKNCEAWANARGWPVGYAKPPAKWKRQNTPRVYVGRHELLSQFIAWLEGLIRIADQLCLTINVGHHAEAGRPTFHHWQLKNLWDHMPEGMNRDVFEEVKQAVTLAFVANTKKYGRWGLAWIETIFRTADWCVSAMDAETFDAFLDLHRYTGKRAERE